jgi:hypothetical protein
LKKAWNRHEKYIDDWTGSKYINQYNCKFNKKKCQSLAQAEDE